MSDLKEVLDKATRNITNTTAGSRFTKTPLVLTNLDKLAEKLAKALTAHIENPETESAVTGAYTSGPGKININMAGPQPTYADMANTIHHEDIHALLDKNNLLKPMPFATSDIPAKLAEIFWRRSIGAGVTGFERGNRAGDVDIELPAYYGAFNPKQMPGVTESDRQNYFKLIQSGLPAKVAEQYMRIANSADAAQAVGVQ